MARVVGVVAALSVTSAAAAYWTTTGNGTAAAQTTTALPLTLSPGVPSDRLHPGGTADVAVTITNPNGFTVRVGSLTLDTTQGTNGYAVDGGHSGCAVSALTFAAQGNNGAGWSVPPKVGGVDGTLAVSLAGALSMAASAADACQGATVTVYLKASADYQSAALNTAGLVSYWRLGEDPAVTETFTDGPGTALQSHTGETGATWTPLAGSGTSDAVVTDANRLRRDGNYAVYTVSGAATGADYAVQADVYVRSTVAGDMTGVIGRANTGNPNGTFYYAGYHQSDGSWHVVKYLNGVPTNLATSAPVALTVGQSYRLRLNMVGTTIGLYVNDVQQASATDASITAAGRAGMLDGDPTGGTTSALSHSTGLQLDNFSVVGSTGTTVTDMRGVNPGTFAGGPLLNVPGALAGNVNTATRFNGSTSYASANRQIADNFSVEFWFSSTQGLSTGVGPVHWSMGAGMVDADAVGVANDFGVSLRADGAVVAGVGNPDTSVVSATGFNDGAWHHAVMTRTKSSGAIKLYLDGAPAGSATGGTASLNAQSTVNFGRLATGGNYFAGVLDDVAVYDAVLTDATVADHYRIGS